MALTVSEASAVNKLIDFVTGQRDGTDQRASSGDALDAAELLARGANKRLSAGYRGDGDVANYWPRRIIRRT